MVHAGAALLAACLFASLPTSALAAKPVLSLSSAAAAVGSEVEISWQAEGSSKVFLTGYGVVESTGSRKFKAEQSRIYILVADGPTGVSLAAQPFTVQGGKGGDSPVIDRSAFLHPLRERLTITSFTDLCSRIQDVLQNELGFSVAPYEIPRDQFIIYAEPSIRPELLGSDEPKIGGRRLAYLVEIPLPAGKLPAEVQLTIRTSIQYRRKIESTWRPETADKFHRQAADHLWVRILAAFGSPSQP